MHLGLTYCTKNSKNVKSLRFWYVCTNKLNDCLGLTLGGSTFNVAYYTECSYSDWFEVVRVGADSGYNKGSCRDWPICDSQKLQVVQVDKA